MCLAFPYLVHLPKSFQPGNISLKMVSGGHNTKVSLPNCKRPKIFTLPPGCCIVLSKVDQILAHLKVTILKLFSLVKPEKKNIKLFTLTSKYLLTASRLLCHS